MWKNDRGQETESRVKNPSNILDTHGENIGSDISNLRGNKIEVESPEAVSSRDQMPATDAEKSYDPQPETDSWRDRLADRLDAVFGRRRASSPSDDFTINGKKEKDGKIFSLFKGHRAAAQAYHDTASDQPAGRKFRILCKVWAAVFFIVLAVFVFSIIRTDILPPTYLYTALILIGVLSLLVFPLLYFDFIKKGRKVAALVLSGAMIVVFSFASVSLGDTNDFFADITTDATQTRDFYIVVPKNSKAQKLKDIHGTNVGTYLTTNADYSTAKSKLTERVDINIKQQKKLSKLDNKLYKGDYDAIFLSSSLYKTMSDNEKAFRKKTKIIYTMKMDISGEDLSKDVDVTKKPFNIYISGLDTSGKITETSRSDVNMIVTVNPVTHSIMLTSIPRDYQIRLSSYDNATDKLTHTGIYGVKESIRSVEDLMGLDINYFVKVNYSTVKKFINAIGGVDVYSDYEFTTHGQAAHYTFKKGKNHLNGRQALAFARERKSFEDGDVQRNKDQAKVMEAMLKKATNSTTILTNYAKILNSVKDYMKINMKSDQIRSLVKMQLANGYKWKIYKQNLNGSGSYQTCYSTGDYEVYVMKPNKEKVTEAAKNIVAVMDGTYTEKPASDKDKKDSSKSKDGKSDKKSNDKNDKGKKDSDKEKDSKSDKKSEKKSN